MNKLTKKFNNILNETRDLEMIISESDLDDGSYYVRFNCVRQLLDDIRLDLVVKDKYRKEGLAQ